jgi:D-alanine-D-alanine ligase
MKKNIALVAGGYSGEYVISVESARMIKSNIDPERYNVFTIIITRDCWRCLFDNGQEADVDKNDFSVQDGDQHIVFDCAFITIHGTPGEDGLLQAYFELLGIPYTTAGILPSALTFNKYFCNAMVAHLGLPVARSTQIKANAVPALGEILKKVMLPVFVKPNKGGSSLGTTFVEAAGRLLPAVSLALEHDNEVLVEEYLPGTELTCGAFTTKGQIRVLPVTEIVSKTQARFFDFKAKYTKGAADEITPARISEELTGKVKDTTAYLYKQLDLKGLVRFDYIYSRDMLFFLEVNITPGMAETSIVPQQAAVEGIAITDLFSMIIEESLERK